MRNTQQTKQKNTQKHFAGDGDRDDFAKDGSTWGTHTVIGSTPLQINTVELIPHHARPKKAEPGRHACQRAKGSLAREDHVPSSDNRRDLYFQ